MAGGAGFIGSAFVRLLASDVLPGLPTADVVVLDALTYAASPAALPESVQLVRGDICLASVLDDVLPGCDLVVNFAAESHVDRSLDDPAPFARTNVMGVQSLLDACQRHRVPRVVQVSTDEVYGPSATPCGEDAPLRPTSPYAASKAAGDLFALSYARSFGLDVRLTRGSNTYGPWQYPEKIVPLFVLSMLDGRPAPLYGQGSQLREWLHVDDHCRAIAQVAVAGAPGGVYNIGGGTALSNRELALRLAALCGANPSLIQPVVDPRGPAHDASYALEWSRLAQLGWRPITPFEQGLADTVEWYRTSSPWRL